MAGRSRPMTRDGEIVATRHFVSWSDVSSLTHLARDRSAARETPVGAGATRPTTIAAPPSAGAGPAWGRRPGEGIPDWRLALYVALFAVGLLSLFALIYMMEPAPWR